MAVETAGDQMQTSSHIHSSEDAIPEPKPLKSLQDPRVEAEGNVGLLGFYYPDREEPCDALCGAGFLGNFWQMKPQSLTLTAPVDPQKPHHFNNAEAAFQALKFWNCAERFTDLSGTDAFRLKKGLRGTEDFSYGGFGSNWKGMLAVLRAKYAAESPMANALLQTQDAFLLEHNACVGRDKIWSNNCDGSGTNWLGLQLMLVRDELSGSRDWTEWLCKHVDLSTGKMKDDKWQQAVKVATATLAESLARN